MMNYSLTLLVFVSVTSFQLIYGFQRFDLPTMQMIEKYTNAVTKCKNEFNASNETIKNMFRMETQDDKCFTGCVMELVGMIKGSGSNWEFLETNMTRVFGPYATKCEGKVNEDKCELAYEIGSCFRNEGEKFQSKQDYADAAQRAKLKCKETSKLSDEALDDVMRDNHMDTHDKKCFMACVMEQMGVMKDNTYDWESHTDSMQFSYWAEPQIKIFIKNCKATANEDKCELAHEIVSCLKAEATKFKQQSVQQEANH